MELELQSQVIWPLVGGVIIGVSVTLMLFFNGRVTGISGIANGLLTGAKEDRLWRALFLLGMFLGGIVCFQFRPDLFANTSGRDLLTIGVGGFLVGLGTVMGGGCTSGHGVCGVSRLSPRSLIATLVFMLFGFSSVTILRILYERGWL